MNDCDVIRTVIEKIESGANPDAVIPYDLRGMSTDCIKELMMIYLKYGGNDERKAIVKDKLKKL